VYIGLQQKTIDAQENPYEVIVSNRLYEQQKYIIETNHLPHLISFIVSEKFYEKLSSEDQDIINKAAQVAIDYSRKVSDERVEEKMDIIKSTGTEIIPISENLRDEMIEASQSVYNNIRDVVGNDLINLYTNHK
ncbi:MAG: TRAP transporter substrate-binding protein DctP, partial [Clostridium butyricum]